ncbi:MAG: hypothetical protein NT069_25560 [Planctomycetota bacterium]|nr:hypothetical protein [Planctomycetota bacterium]
MNSEEEVGISPREPLRLWRRCVQLLSGLVAILLLSLVTGFAIHRLGLELPQPVAGPLMHEGRTPDEWIAQLQEASDDRSRAAAAEALGFMARETQWTYGGFSDVPIYSDEPPQLDANALTAIGRIGPEAKAAIPQLEPMLSTEVGDRRVAVAKTMRLIGADLEVIVPVLVEMLGQEGDHHASLELAEIGNPAGKQKLGQDLMIFRTSVGRPRQSCLFQATNTCGSRCGTSTGIPCSRTSVTPFSADYPSRFRFATPLGV